MKRVVLTGLSVAAAVAASLWPKHAEAQVAVDWQGSATAGIGVTTNESNAAVPKKTDRKYQTNPVDGSLLLDANGKPEPTPIPKWDGFGDVSPTIQLDLETKRTRHVLSYVFDYRYYLLNNRANTISNTVGYSMTATLSARVDYAMGITLAQSQLSAFNQQSSPSTSTTLATIAGNSYLFTGVANQALHVQASANNVFSEGLAFTANHTIPVAAQAGGIAGFPFETYVVSGTLSLMHQFQRDALGGEVGTDGLIFPDQRTMNAIVLSHIDVVHRATVDWRHQYNPEWSSTLDAGLLVAYEPKTSMVTTKAPSPAFQPAGTASIDYATERGTAGISYSHAAQPNLYTQQLALVDTVALRGGLPIYRSGFDIEGTVGALASRPLLLDVGGFGNVTYAALADAELGYTKETWPVRFSLRYDFSRQMPIGKQNTSQGIPEVLEIRRQNLMFAVTAYFPHPPALGTHGPSPVTIPSPGSNPDIIARQERTRGQMEDKDRKNAHDRRSEKGGEKSDSGDSSSDSDSP